MCKGHKYHNDYVRNDSVMTFECVVVYMWIKLWEGRVKTKSGIIEVLKRSKIFEKSIF